MRAKCPRCRAVFEVKNPMLGVLLHVGSMRYTKCPACGKSGMMNNFVSDPVTWPPQEGEGQTEKPPSEEELKKKRLDESKYEDTLS